MANGEGLFSHTVETKSGQSLVLPDIHPPPDALVQNMGDRFGCRLCTRLQTEDMIICTRCGEEYHASCLYGEDYDYNNWLCSDCADVLSHLNSRYNFIKLHSEMIEMNSLAPMGIPAEKHQQDPSILSRMQWLYTMWSELPGSCVLVPLKSSPSPIQGRILFVDSDRLMVYVAFRGEWWYCSGWYALERSEVVLLRQLVWIEDPNNIRVGWKIEKYCSTPPSLSPSSLVDVYDLASSSISPVPSSWIRPFLDWREHKLDLAFTPEEDIIRWEVRVRSDIRSWADRHFSIPADHPDLNGKEWMYKWIYMWSRQVDFPLGGWARGVVLHYRSLTGKHFVCFENDDIPSGWFYLNSQYIVIEGNCHE